MREIGYRAYDPVLGMLPVASIDFESQTVTVACENETYYTLSFHKGVPLEGTGLKDKNDKEIYEGDIVRYENKDAEYIEGEGIGLIQRDSHSHCVNGFSCRDIKTKYYIRLLCGHSLFSIEIIGNIYENPELKEATG